MELDNIEKLVEKYFEATTTVAEEEILRTYFSHESVATHLEQYTPIFRYYSKAKGERFIKQVSLKPKRNYFKWVSVVVVVLTFGIYFANTYRVEQQQAEYAYHETKRALSLLATNFSKVTKKVAYLNEFEETKQKIYNND